MERLCVRSEMIEPEVIITYTLRTDQLPVHPEKEWRGKVLFYNSHFHRAVVKSLEEGYRVLSGRSMVRKTGAFWPVGCNTGIKRGSGLPGRTMPRNHNLSSVGATLRSPGNLCYTLTSSCIHEGKLPQRLRAIGRVCQRRGGVVTSRS